MYLTREAEPLIRQYVNAFKVLLVTGARQVGKTTVLKHLVQDSYEYVTLDNLQELETARTDPYAFFLNHPGKTLIDEVQYAPDLLRVVKERVDASAEKGQYLLTGSQTFSLMQGVSESLAGRVGVVELPSLSLREIERCSAKPPFPFFVESDASVAEAAEAAETVVNQVLRGKDLWERIFQGSMPELATNPDMPRQGFYDSYLKTYVERDLREVLAVRDLGQFHRFINALAALDGRVLNYQSIANDLGVTGKTVKSWIGILESSGLIFLLPAFANNDLKRALKTPKLYFSDTGLVTHLLRWPNAETLAQGPMSGEIFENFVVTEILKSFRNRGILRPPLSFFRNKDGAEIDLIVEDGNKLYPLEIKQTATPTARMGRHLGALDALPGLEVKQKILICQVERPLYLSQDLLAFPAGAL